MIRRTVSALPLVWLIFAPALIVGQGTEISGTWVGETELLGAPDKDRITLVLQKNETSYAGTISDSLGMIKNAPLENVRFENDNLRFKFTAVIGGREVKLRIALNSFMGRLIGSWATEESPHAYGALELRRQK